MGLEALIDGIDPVVALLGLTVVADGVTCVVSPSRFVTSYARLVTDRGARRVPRAVAVSMRVAAALAVLAAGFVAWQVEARLWDVGTVLVLGLFGVVGKALGWNRLVLLVAMTLATTLDENIRRALLLSDGDPTIFLQQPIGAVLAALTGIVLAASAVLSFRRARVA